MYEDQGEEMGTAGLGLLVMKLIISISGENNRAYNNYLNVRVDIQHLGQDQDQQAWEVRALHSHNTKYLEERQSYREDLHRCCRVVHWRRRWPKLTWPGWAALP